MNNNQIDYKGILIEKNEDYSYIKYKLNNSILENVEIIVEYLIKLTEAIHYTKSLYILICVTNNNTDLKKPILEFIKSTLIEQLKRDGVKGIFIIVKDKVYYEKLKKMTEKDLFISVFKSIKDAQDFISKSSYLKSSMFQ